LRYLFCLSQAPSNSNKPPHRNLKKLKAPNEFCPFHEVKPACNFNDIYRRIDGSCNNMDRPFWGKSNTPYIRILDAKYDDGNCFGSF
jgi:hypothetical protein